MRVRSLFRPEYLFRPSQVVRRILLPVRDKRTGLRKVSLPWSLDVMVDSREAIGRSVLTIGLYELLVAESIFRLCDHSECAVDVGANIGLMTSAMVSAVGSGGTVLCFEPNPPVFLMLQSNIALWGKLSNAVQARSLALSAKGGAMTLYVSREFGTNRGVGTLESHAMPVPVALIHTVQVARLDDLVIPGRPIGLMKMDVEGHEAAVLEGAQHIICTKGVRDIVFEENAAFPSLAHKFLMQRGYSLFRVWKTLLRPRLISPTEPVAERMPPTYLATIDPGRAEQRFKQKGWRALKKRSIWPSSRSHQQ